MMNQAEQLLKKIKYYNTMYRKGTPKISDAAYDGMVAKLKRVDPDNEWFTSIEPAEVKKQRKVTLPIPMKSLDKVKSIDELIGWVKSTGHSDDCELVLTPKFDGLSLLVDEKTFLAYSRGGAENEGQDCTRHIQHANISKCEAPVSDYTFGEFVFNRKNWEENFSGKICADTGDKYKSPRNTAAGLLNRDEPSDNLKFIDFFRYGVEEDALANFSSYEELFAYLCQNYNQKLLYKTVKANQLTKQLLEDTYKEWCQEYYADGIVLYINDLRAWEALGRKETTGNPNYAIAYKHPSFTEEFTTTVKKINWNIAKSGAFKPVVVIDTINTGDCDMDSPTGFNAKYIKENHIGPDAKIKVTRSGGVIPKITSVIQEAPTNIMNDVFNDLLTCPHCGQPTRWSESGVELMCKNPDCPGINLAKIIFFYFTIGTENMGREIITRIFNAGYNTLNDILEISFDELMKIEGFGETIANNVLQHNRRIKKGVDIITLMHASDCFPGIGKVKAKAILDAMTPEERLSIMLGHPKFHIEPPISKTLASFYSNIEKFLSFVANNNLVMLPLDEKEITGERLKGVKVCFTGVRSKELEEAIEKEGGAVVSTVSPKTTHLIVKDISSTSAKIQRAKSLKINIITLDNFITEYQLLN